MLDGRADSRVGAAAADVAGHRGVDVRIGGLRLLRQERRGRHDLARLAVAALDDLEIEPRLLDLLTGRSRTDGLDRCDRLAGGGAHPPDAGAATLSAEVHRTGPAAR